MLKLRPYKDCDAKEIVRWIHDEYSFHQWCADRYEKFPITAEDIIEHYAAYAQSDDFYEFTAFDEDKAAGHMIMRYMDREKTILRFGFVIVDDQKRGKGYGRQMLTLALTYAFEILKADKVTIGVFENNPAAYRCYKAVGFRESSSKPSERCHILGEEWLCLELEMERSAFPISSQTCL